MTLLAVVDSLDRGQPGLCEVERRLSGVIVKYADADKKKPKLHKMKNPDLIQNPFYLLPTKLLDACMSLLPVSNSKEDAIAIDQSQPVQETDNKPVKSVETVVIKDVGCFSREQIETFKRVANLKNLYSWVRICANGYLKTGFLLFHHIGAQVAAEVIETNPYKRIDGLPGAMEYSYAMLYRAVPPMWLTDAAISALCSRLS